MNTPFDRRVRDVHARSLEALSPRVQAQLVQRRRAALALALPAASRMTHARWGWIGAAATACVLVVAVQVGPSRQALPAAPQTVAVQDVPPDPGSVLAEDPEFYLWLASNEARTITE